MKELNELVEQAERADSLCLLMQNVNPHHILAVDDELKTLKQRAEAAEAKLQEMEEQEPVGYHRGEARAVFRVWPYADGDICVPVYSRPAPAINLADLVPDVEEDESAFLAGLNALVDCLEDCGDADQGLRLALRASRGAILRNIEEQSQ